MDELAWIVHEISDAAHPELLKKGLVGATVRKAGSAFS